MSISPTPPDAEQPRDATFWAQYVSTLKVTNIPTDALNLNVEGRRVVSPLQGFGRMWQKRYRLRLTGATVTPVEVIKTWKENFTHFWPKGNHFYAPITGIAPGEVAIINMIIPGGLPLSTGVMVLYADDESFTFMTPQGHTFSGWITFSAYDDNGTTVVQALVLMRPYDPIYEVGFRLGASKAEDIFWERTLKSLAARFDVNGTVEIEKICIDPKLQWSEAKNILHNSAIITTMYTISAPIRWIRRRVKR